MSGGPIEPSADMLQAAYGLRELFLALTWEGFDEHQALTLCGAVLTAQAAKA